MRFRLRRTNVAALLSLMVGAALGITGAAAQETDSGGAPEIYALVIGVGSYLDFNLTHPTGCATAFARAVENTYQTKPDVLLDEQATLLGLRERLYRKMANLPEHSLFIFYFAGHGERLDLPRHKARRAPYKLFLRLSETTANEYLGNSLALSEVAEALTYTRRVNAMLFVDCCFSGAVPPEMSVLLRTKEPSLRSFMLASSSVGETSQKGYFTKALLDAMKHGKPCLTPRDLKREVAKQLKKYNRNMNVKLAFETVVERCWVRLHEPSCLLIFEFPYGAKHPLQFYINKAKDPEEYDPGEDAVFVRQVARERTVVRAESHGHVVFEQVFTPEERDMVKCCGWRHDQAATFLTPSAN